MPTIKLHDGSPAISAGGHVLGISTDARGVVRPNDEVSAGAYQFVKGASTTTPANGSNGSLAKTGALAVSSTVLGGLFLGSFAFVYYDYRRHKAPLKTIDPAVHYTLGHHIKVVTLPILKYRLSIQVVHSYDGSGGKSIHRF